MGSGESKCENTFGLYLLTVNYYRKRKNELPRNWNDDAKENLDWKFSAGNSLNVFESIEKKFNVFKNDCSFPLSIWDAVRSIYRAGNDENIRRPDYQFILVISKFRHLTPLLRQPPMRNVLLNLLLVLVVNLLIGTRSVSALTKL